MASFNSIEIESGQEHTPSAQMAQRLSSDCAVTSGPKTIIDDYRSGKRSLKIEDKKGETMDVCATISDKYVCCNVQVLKSVSNCPFDCSYCFLQNYLNDGTTKVVGNIDAMMQEVRDKTSAQPDRLFRIGTWELGDSLALETVTGQATQLIPEFAKLSNAILELKTKSDVVDPILHLDHQGKTVVSWSMNSDFIIRTQEHKTASLTDRIAAIKKVAQAGYLLGIHFDPMILHPEWETEYEAVVKAIFDVAPPEQMAWISMGSLRFNPEMKKKMEHHFPAQNISREEMILGDDGKLRYPKPVRVDMYRRLLSDLNRYGGEPLFVYLCMERWDVWDKVMGDHPDSIEHLDYLFAQSLCARYPQFGHLAPSRSVYLNTI